MSSFDVRDGQFWLNDHPILIHAGEFHYYRTPADQWAHRLGLLQQAGFNAVAMYIPWLWHQPAPDVSDLDGHTHPMRDLAGFIDLATEMGLYVIARPGPYIMAETINEGIPPWVFERFPQAAFVSQGGKTENVASYMHPDFLAAVEGWYRAVFDVLTPRQVTHGGNILLIQLDNEMGMIQWVRNIVDINPDTIARFAADLRRRYGDGLSVRYPAADLAGLLHEQLNDPKLPHAVPVLEDYRRFYRGYLREYKAHLWTRAKHYGMDVPPVLNIHGFANGGKTFPIGISQLIDAMAIDGMVSATDVYPRSIGEGNYHQLLLVNEMTKAVQNPQQALFSIEFKAGGNQDFSGEQASFYDLHSRLCISCGMRAINHYLFFDGENDPVLSPVKRHDWGHPVRKDGSLRAHYHRYPKLSRMLSAYGDDLVRSRPATVATIGYVLDQFMTEIDNAFTKPATDILTHQRDTVLFDFLARGLALTHRPFEAVELARTALDAKQTPVLWVMMEKQCDADVQQSLADYVRQGGTLVIAGRLCEETFDHEPCTILKDAIGINGIYSDPPFTRVTIQAFDYPDVPASFVETYGGDFDEVFATSADGDPVGVFKRVGDGRVMLFGAALPANTLEDIDIVNQMANRVGCAPAFSMSEWADVRLSTGERGSFLFVNNYRDDPVETVISSAGTPLLGGNAVSLPARHGAVLPIEWQVRPGIVVHYLTSEVVEVADDGARVLLRTARDDAVAELSLAGYHCAPSLDTEPAGGRRVKVRVGHGVIELIRGPDEQ
ncbi:MAG: beta-galactosidase [Chloroflexi bacterium]|nr:beta-galactosidase [Chloroflexota bacterium]